MAEEQPMEEVTEDGELTWSTVLKALLRIDLPSGCSGGERLACFQYFLSQALGHDRDDGLADPLDGAAFPCVAGKPLTRAQAETAFRSVCQLLREPVRLDMLKLDE